MRTQLPDNLIRFLVFLGFILVWQLSVQFIELDMLPSPFVVFQQLLENISNGELLHHLSITLTRVGISFVVALSVGFFIGCLMGWFRWVDLLLDVLVTLALNIPALVVIILCYIWLGLHDWVAILAVILNKAPLVIVTIREGVKSIDDKLLEVARVFKLGPWKTFWKVFFPQLYPYILTCIRNGLSLIWKVVLVVELIGCSDGVGFQLGIFFQFFDIANILAYTFAFAIVVLLIEALVVQPWERKITEWRYD
jgi:ABC-type nitrate/sulfonate/bicarbonate transport system permease component